MELYNGGWVTSVAGIWREGDDFDRQIRFPIPVYMIETETQRILVDTGLDPDALDDPARAMFALELEMSIAQQLDLATLTKVVLTHLHFDHAGGLALLPPSVPVIVQRSEWVAGHDRAAIERNFYSPADYAAIRDQVVLVDGDHDLLGDGSVELLLTPGHTPGHQSVRVGDDLVIGADVTHLASGLDDHRFPLFAHDFAAQAASAEFLRSLRDAGATVLPGHDPDVLKPGVVRDAARSGTLTVTAAQPPCVSHDVVANVAAHAAAVRSAEARVAVFPELSLTGYELGAPTISPGDPRLAPLMEACADIGAVALVGAPVDGENGAAHIAMLAVDGSGTAVAYRKMWLGGAEHERFSPGGEPVVLEVDGWRLGLAICKDTGVPEHAAATAALGIDAYLVGACDRAEEADVQPERARRVVADHAVWAVVASFAGPTGGGFVQTAGGSAIYAPDGTAVAKAGPEPGAAASAVLTEKSNT